MGRRSRGERRVVFEKAAVRGRGIGDCAKIGNIIKTKVGTAVRDKDIGLGKRLMRYFILSCFFVGDEGNFGLSKQSGERGLIRLQRIFFLSFDLATTRFLFFIKNRASISVCCSQ